MIPAKNLPEGFVGIPSSYVVKVEDLAPGRIEGKKLNQSYYRLRLSIYITA